MRRLPDVLRRSARRSMRRLRSASVPTLVAVCLAACASGESAPPPENPPPAASASGEAKAPPGVVTMGPGGVRANDSGSPGSPAASPSRRTAPGAGEADFARTFVAADRRIDEYVALDPSAPGAERQRERIASALEAFATEHLERLLAGAADTADPDRRLRSVKALAFANDRRATAAATEALDARGDSSLATAAGFALARIADPDTSLDSLLAAARAEDVDVRVNALLALARVLEARGVYANYLDQNGRDRILELLGSALFDPADATARGNAAAVAAALADPRAAEPLLNLLKDEDPFVRTHTATALGRVGGRDAIGPLLAVVDETPAGPPRTALLAAVERILDKERIEVPDGLPEEEAVWTEFVERAFADRAKRPVR